MTKTIVSAICVLLVSTGAVFAQGNVQNAKGEAWVSCESDDACIGFIFEANKDLVTLMSADNGKTWMGIKAGKWNTKGSNLELTISMMGTGTTAEGPYTVSGKKLTLKDPQDGENKVMEKKTGITYQTLPGM